MKPFYTDDWLTLYGGDCRTVMEGMPADSVDCVVTSPPYWGLRDYGTATWDGGDTECDHAAAKKKTRYDYALDSSPIQQGSRTGTDAQAGMYAPECPACGATRQDSQLGLERTPEEYVANMVAVFREVRRVLKPSGTCWLNLGDSYAGNGKGDTYSGFNERYHGTTSQTDKQGQAGRSRVSAVQGASVQRVSRSSADYGDRLKPKDLVGIPWRVAFALQADGWYLRSEIIWSKPNPMPESVTDRPTKSHEYLFLLTKSARYYFDNEAVREPEKPWNAGWVRAPKMGAERINGAGKAGTTEKQYDTVKGANIRSVWTIATRPYPGAHFAVFPPELPERCIKAGSSERGVCPETGEPWERVVERNPDANARNERIATPSSEGFAEGAGHTVGSASDRARKLDGKNYVQQAGLPGRASRRTLRSARDLHAPAASVEVHRRRPAGSRPVTTKPRPCLPSSSTPSLAAAPWAWSPIASPAAPSSSTLTPNIWSSR